MRKTHPRQPAEIMSTSLLPIDHCLAKSRKTVDGITLPGRSVFSHCRIVGEVARALVARMPTWLRVALFPDGVELIAAAHDIGKVSPTFQKKIHAALTQGNEAVLLALQAVNPDTEKLWGGHAGVNQDDNLTGLDGVQANDQYQLSYNASQGYLAKKRGQK